VNEASLQQKEWCIKNWRCNGSENDRWRFL